MGLSGPLRYRLLRLRARRSAVDHPPGTGKAPGSNPGESTHFLPLTALAPVVRGLADPRERLRRSLSPGESIEFFPTQTAEARRAAATRREQSASGRRGRRRSDLNPWKSQPGSAAERAPRNVFLRVQIPASPLTSFRSLRSLQSFVDSPTFANAEGVRSVPASPLDFCSTTRRAT